MLSVPGIPAIPTSVQCPQTNFVCSKDQLQYSCHTPDLGPFGHLGGCQASKTRRAQLPTEPGRRRSVRILYNSMAVSPAFMPDHGRPVAYLCPAKHGNNSIREPTSQRIPEILSCQEESFSANAPGSKERHSISVFWAHITYVLQRTYIYHEDPQSSDGTAIAIYSY